MSVELSFSASTDLIIKRSLLTPYNRNKITNLISDRGYTIKNQHAVHFITFAVVQWIGIDVFTRKEYAGILVKSLKLCQKEKG